MLSVEDLTAQCLGSLPFIDRVRQIWLVISDACFWEVKLHPSI